MAADNDGAKSDGTSRRSWLLPALVVVVLMVAEGIGIAVLVSVVSPPPTPTQAAELPEGEGESSHEEFAEIELAECRPSNNLTGKIVTFHVRVSALVASADAATAEEKVRARKARIEHTVNTVIRSAEPKHLAEPQLNTLERRLKLEFDRLFGDDLLIKRVLITQLLQSSR